MLGLIRPLSESGQKLLSSLSPLRARATVRSGCEKNKTPVPSKRDLYNHNHHVDVLI